MSKEESKMINILNKRTKYAMETIQYQDSRVVFHLSNFKITRKAELKDKTPVLTITFKATAAINEINTNANLSDPNTIQEIQTGLEQKMTKQIQDTIDAMQKRYKTDIFGFGNLFYQKYPDYFKEVESKWNEEEFQKVKLNINMNIDLETKGSLEQTIRREMYGKKTE